MGLGIEFKDFFKYNNKTVSTSGYPGIGFKQNFACSEHLGSKLDCICLRFFLCPFNTCVDLYTVYSYNSYLYVYIFFVIDFTHIIKCYH
jgi:hypothetical protein